MPVIMKRAKALIVHALFLQLVEVAYHVHYACRVLDFLFSQFVYYSHRFSFYSLFFRECVRQFCCRFSRAASRVVGMDGL
jgi:hypothetical protein